MTGSQEPHLQWCKCWNCKWCLQTELPSLELSNLKGQPLWLADVLKTEHHEHYYTTSSISQVDVYSLLHTPNFPLFFWDIRNQFVSSTGEPHLHVKTIQINNKTHLSWGFLSSTGLSSTVFLFSSSFDTGRLTSATLIAVNGNFTLCNDKTDFWQLWEFMKSKNNLSWNQKKSKHLYLEKQLVFITHQAFIYYKD